MKADVVDKAAYVLKAQSGSELIDINPQVVAELVAEVTALRVANRRWQKQYEAAIDMLGGIIAEAEAEDLA